MGTQELAAPAAQSVANRIPTQNVGTRKTSIALGSKYGQPAMKYALVFLLLFFAIDASAESVVLRGAAQGTTYHIKYVASEAPIDVTVLQSAVDKLLADIDRQMSTYRDDSEISRFNRSSAGEWFEVSPAVVAVVSAAREISEKTGGAMDVTVGPLVRLWHFGRGARGEERD